MASAGCLRVVRVRASSCVHAHQGRNADKAGITPQLPPIKMVDSQGMEKAIIASPTGLGANCLSGTLPPNAFTTNSFPPTT
jgi:hypothetical protein